MNAQDFLKMMEQDTVTMSDSDKELYGQVLICMQSAAQGYRGEIDGAKNLKDGYKAIEDYASKNRTGNRAYVSMAAAIRIMREYLGIPEIVSKTASTEVNLEDFL